MMKRVGLVFVLWASLSFAAVAQIGGLSFPGPGPVAASGGGGATVTVTSSSATPTNTSTVASATVSTITVSGSNTALICLLDMQQATPTGLTVAWDVAGANQSMTQIGTTVVTGDFGSQVSLWGLVNPAAGNKTATANWTTASNIVMTCIAFAGVNQTGGTTTFANFNSLGSQAAATSYSLNVTAGSANDIVLALASSFATLSALTNTTIFTQSTNADFKTGANYKTSPTVGVNAIGGTLSGGFAWAVVGVEIVHN